MHVQKKGGLLLFLCLFSCVFLSQYIHGMDSEQESEEVVCSHCFEKFPMKKKAHSFYETRPVNVSKSFSKKRSKSVNDVFFVKEAKRESLVATQALLDAIKENNLEKVKKAIKHGGDVNGFIKNASYSPLLKAVINIRDYREESKSKKAKKSKKFRKTKIAEEKRAVQIFEMLLKFNTINEKFDLDIEVARYVLFFAQESGLVDVAETLDIVINPVTELSEEDTSAS